MTGLRKSSGIHNGQCWNFNCECHKPKVYILKKDCSNIGKEVGDYYNGEYAESIEELLAKGVIEEEIITKKINSYEE